MNWGSDYVPMRRGASGFPPPPALPWWARALMWVLCRPRKRTRVVLWAVPNPSAGGRQVQFFGRVEQATRQARRKGKHER